MQYSLFAQLTARDPRKVVRFPDVPYDDALSELQKLRAALEELKAATPPPAAVPPAQAMPPVIPAEAPKPEPAANLDEWGGSLANLATQVWRARNRIVDPATGEPREEMRRVFRHVEGAYEVLGQMGVVIQDWVKQPYDAGLPVKVLTFQPETDIQRDTVLEAVRPTVIWKDRLLQMGEVIVGTPPNTEEPHK